MSFNLSFNVRFDHVQTIENKALTPPTKTFQTGYAILLTHLDAKLLVWILSTKLVPTTATENIVLSRGFNATSFISPNLNQVQEEIFNLFINPQASRAGTYFLLG